MGELAGGSARVFVAGVAITVLLGGLTACSVSMMSQETADAGNAASSDGATSADAGNAERTDASNADSSVDESQESGTTDAASHGYSWASVPAGGGGYIVDVVVHPVSDDVYVRADVGGAYRWDWTQNRWIPLTDGFTSTNDFGIGGLALDPNDPNTVYIASGAYFWGGNGDVLKSTDKGATWHHTNLNLPMGGNQYVTAEVAGDDRLAVDPNDGSVVYFGAYNEGLWATTDGGGSWHQVTSFPVNGDANAGLGLVVFDKSSGTAGSPTPAIYVGVIGAGFYVSHNAGASWSFLGGPGSGAYPVHATVASDGTLWATFSKTSSSSTGALYKYASGTWTDVSPVHDDLTGLAVDPTDPNHVVTAKWSGSGIIYQTTDAGSTWTSEGPVWQSNSGLTTSVGVPWYQSNGWDWGDGIEALAFDAKDPARLWYCGMNITVWRTDNYASAVPLWSTESPGLEEQVASTLKSFPSGAPLMVGDFDVVGFRYTDPSQYPPKTLLPIYNNVTGIDFAEQNPQFVAMIGGQGDASQATAYYSSDNGVSWTSMSAIPTTDAVFGRLAVSADGGSIVWIPGGASAHTPYRTTDKGSSWTAATGVPSGAIDVSSSSGRWNTYDPLAADRVLASNFYVYMPSTGDFYRSTDGGSTFTKTTTLPSSPYPDSTSGVRALPGAGGDVWINLGSHGLYRSTDAGSTFAPIASVQYASSFSFGAPAPGHANPSVFLFGTTASDTTLGIFRSDDFGQAWTRIDEPNLPFGNGGCYLEADRQVYGRVYCGTGGRGVIYGHL